MSAEAEAVGTQEAAHLENELKPMTDNITWKAGGGAAEHVSVFRGENEEDDSGAQLFSEAGKQRPGCLAIFTGRHGFGQKHTHPAIRRGFLPGENAVLDALESGKMKRVRQGRGTRLCDPKTAHRLHHELQLGTLLYHGFPLYEERRNVIKVWRTNDLAGKKIERQ